MSKTRRGLSFVLCLVMVLSLVAGIPIASLDLGTKANAADTNTNPGNSSEWVTAWHTSMLYLDAASDVNKAVSVVSELNERTFRTVIPMTISGNTVRLTYSNEYAPNGETLKIGEITLAKGDPNDAARWLSSTSVKLKDMNALFKTAIANGQADVANSYYQDSGILRIKPGEVVVSEPIDISALGLNAMDYLSVSTWVCDMNSNYTGFKNGFTGGLIGGETKYLGLALGGSGYNHTEATDLDGVGLVPSVALSSSNDTGDYNVVPFLNTVEVLRESITGVKDTSNAYTTVIFGDSTVANDIPVYLAQNLKSGDIDGVAVTWAAVKGNEVLLNGQDGSGDSNGNIMDEAAISVVDEVKKLSGVKKVILKVGINDILHPQCSDMAANFASRTPDEIAQQIIAGYKYIVEQLHNEGIEVYFYELTPWRADDGSYYSRNESISAWTQEIDNIRLKVNAWLNTYGDKYDKYVNDRKTGSGDGYTGDITIGNQYGAKGYTKAYETKTVTVSQDTFDRFGFISLEELGNNKTSIDAFSGFDGITALKKSYTTDGIHYTAAGQSKVAKLTPTSIFYQRQDTYNGAGEEVTVDGIYFATKALTANNNYFICNTDAASIKDDASGSNQSVSGYIAGNPGVVSGDDSTGKNSDLESNTVIVQRGTSGAPYIVRKSVEDKNEWTLVYSDSKDSYYWKNGNMFLSWYYPGLIPWYGDYFKTGVIDQQPYHTGVSGWFTFDKITTSSAADNYSVRVWYNTLITGEKTFIFQNGKFISSKNEGNIALYDNTSKGVNIKLDINQDSANLLNVTTDENVVNAASGKTTQLQFRLDSQMLDSNGVPTGTEFHDAPKDNNAKGPYSQYTFGDEQKIFWMSTDPNVATVSQSAASDLKATYTNGGGEVTFTGNGGTTALVANFFWKEHDGTDYVFDNNVKDGQAQYYSTAEKDAAIADGSRVPSETAEGYHWVEIDNGLWVWTNYNWLTSTTKVTNINRYACDILLGGLTNNTEEADNFLFNETPTGKDCTLTAVNASDPIDAKLPGTAWKWESSNTNVAEIASSADEFATLKYNGTGTTTITLTRIDKNGNAVTSDVDGKPITSTITIHVNEIPTVDISFNGTTEDNYWLKGVTAGDSFAMNGFVSNQSNATINSWTWEAYGEDGKLTNKVTVTPDNEQSTTLTLNDVGISYVVLKVHYTLPNGGGKGDVTTAISVNAEYSIATTTNTIIDCGLPVKLDLNASGISRKEPTVELVKGRTADNEFGTAVVHLGFGNASLDNGTVIYTPDKIATAKDTLYYSAAVDNGYKYSDVNIIPGSSVYYEDSFVNFDGNWQPAGTEITGKFQNVNDNAYGYDAAYGEYTTYSMGSAQYVTVNNEYGANLPTYTGEYPTATFTFTGTGFAIYSTSNNKAGYFDIEYTGANTGTHKFSMINAYANGDYIQTPTAQYLNLPYDTYTVTLTVMYDRSFDVAKAGSYTYYLDAIRIYSPMGDDQDAQNAYAEVGEANASFQTIRGMLISKNTFGTIEGDKVTGALFLDGKDPTNVITDYKNYGPKNEVYLGNGQGVAFTLENAASFTDVQLGIKLAGSGTDAGQVIVNGKVIDITSATDMYYSIKDVIGADGRVVIVNTGSGLISLTVLKTTAANPVAVNAMVDTQLGDFAAAKIMSYMTTPVEPTTEPSTEPTTEPTTEPSVEPTVEPSEEPEPSEDPQPSEDPLPSEDPQPGDDDSDKDSPIVGFFKKIGNFFKNLFGGWKR